MLLRLTRPLSPTGPSAPSAAVARARLQRTIAVDRVLTSTRQAPTEDLLRRLLGEMPDEGRAA